METRDEKAKERLRLAQTILIRALSQSRRNVWTAPEPQLPTIELPQRPAIGLPPELSDPPEREHVILPARPELREPILPEYPKEPAKQPPPDKPIIQLPAKPDLGEAPPLPAEPAPPLRPEPEPVPKPEYAESSEKPIESSSLYQPTYSFFDQLFAGLREARDREARVRYEAALRKWEGDNRFVEVKNKMLRESYERRLKESEEICDIKYKPALVSFRVEHASWQTQCNRSSQLGGGKCSRPSKTGSPSAPGLRLKPSRLT